MKKSLGFSLIEIVVVVGILSALMSGAFFIGLPEYNRYVFTTERQYLVDALLESRARSLASGESFNVSIWPNGYCIQDSSGQCIVPFHSLPSNMFLIRNVFATSTVMVLSLDGIQSSEIIIDQNGFIDKQ